MKINKYFNFNNKVILITGCNGQIGTDMCNFFLNLGSYVYGIDISVTKKIKHKKFFFLKQMYLKKKKLEEC
tara:strand:- start:687 stop:899 length:213 start_codon:yes stop_codon:yes gene_type:complete